eukprot:770166-Pelagomonas_calceolata.AAC.1
MACSVRGVIIPFVRPSSTGVSISGCDLNRSYMSCFISLWSSMYVSMTCQSAFGMVHLNALPHCFLLQNGQASMLSAQMSHGICGFANVL